MTTSDLIEAHHLQRRAVIYIRQSTGHQVMSNVESRKLQHAMREHARRLGWDDSRIDIVEADTGNSAQSTSNRDGYKNLLSDVALGQVGIVISYDSARLSRNCSDWYPLLDLCAYQKCLIGDRDGVYDPSSANGRLLLGMKGILSEVELHTLRGRLIAGVRNKARRGELAMCLPAGLLRLEDGRVVKDPNLQVQKAIELVFKLFLDLKVAHKVVRYFNEHELPIPRRHHNRETVWCPATSARIIGILHNPAYAGAFVYGRNRRVIKPGRSSPQNQIRPIEEWTVLIKERYPAYISWETFESIQKTLSDNHAQYERRRSRGVPREGEALLQGLSYCGKCGHKIGVDYSSSVRYVCWFQSCHSARPLCQYIQARPIDEYIVASFFEALSPAELDLYDQALLDREDKWSEVKAAQGRELQRLRYEADLARRQYDRVDPDNRLVASELERRWESALRALREAEERFAKVERERHDAVARSIPPELREAFQSLGKSLPKVWKQETLSQSHRKALLRCLIDKVVMHRREKHELIRVRIVWRGGAVTERDIGVTVNRAQDLSNFDELEARILELEEAGKSDSAISDLLTREGFRSPRSDKVLISTIRTIRSKHGRLRRVIKRPPLHVDGFLTVKEVAKRIGVQTHWVYHRIKTGAIGIERDADRNRYLFPDRDQAIEDLRRLRGGEIRRISITGVSR